MKIKDKPQEIGDSRYFFVITLDHLNYTENQLESVIIEYFNTYNCDVVFEKFIVIKWMVPESTCIVKTK